MTEDQIKASNEKLRNAVNSHPNPWKHWIEELCIVHWVRFDENDPFDTINRLIDATEKTAIALEARQ